MNDRDQVEAARPCFCGGCSVCLGDQGREECTECEGKGWLVMDSDSANCPGTFIERCDSCEEFHNDDEALRFVRRRARAGDQDAIDALAECEPEEE